MLRPLDAALVAQECFGDVFWSSHMGEPVVSSWLPWKEREDGSLHGVVSLRPRGRAPTTESDLFYVYGQVSITPEGRTGRFTRRRGRNTFPVLMAAIGDLADDLRDEYQRIHA